MEPKIKIGMVQINNNFANQSYFPYTAGVLQAFTQKHLGGQEGFEFLLPIHSRIPVKTAVQKLLDADIVCFSAYVWNIMISLEIAEGLKKNRKNTVIVFGGPQVPLKNSEAFLRSNPFIDIACHGEGETIFPLILENFTRREWAKAPSISYINEAGEFIKTPMRERISDLNKVPSPYLEGTFDPLIEAEPQTEWVALWETNRGCPFSCVFCDWGSATKNKIYAHDIEKIFKEIDWFSRHKIEFIFCCDANFGILPRDAEIVNYVAENKKKYGYPKALSVQSTKKFTEHSYKAYKVLADSGLNKGISLSLQSLNKDTLKDTKRENISITAFKETQQKLISNNITTFTDIILGLPNETYDTFACGVSSVIENGQHNRIQFNNLSVLPNAEMGDPEYQKKFGFDIVKTKLINVHGSLSQEAQETQELVVGTNTMPKADWVKARIFGWMAALLHFNKLLQIPFIIAHNICHISFRELIEIFIDENIRFPILADAYSFFIKKAIDIQNGGTEFCESKKWLNIWWPADELILIRLCAENKLTEFYKEAEQVFNDYLRNRKLLDQQSILQESIFLNQNLMKLPFREENRDIDLSYNIWDVYHAAIRGISVPLKRGNYRYEIDRAKAKWLSWEDWCKKVVWYGNKKGAYIYNCKSKSYVFK